MHAQQCIIYNLVQKPDNYTFIFIIKGFINYGYDTLV